MMREFGCSAGASLSSFYIVKDTRVTSVQQQGHNRELLVKKDLEQLGLDETISGAQKSTSNCRKARLN